jgi:hypothetical protein
MRKLLILLLFPLICHAQVKTDSIKWEPFEGIGTYSKPIKLPDTVKIVRKHPITQLALLASSVIASGLGDGMNSRTIYTPGHLLSAYSYLAVLAVPFTGKIDWKMPVSYVLLRYALFDLCYNIGARRKLNYIGGKNYYDESVGRMPLSVMNGTKIIGLGIVIYLNRK